jgi:hypothetical protein
MLMVVMLIMPATAMAATERVLLRTTESFAILAGEEVTNTGSSVITGDIGVHPGASVVGFPPGTYTGAIHAGDAVALQAKNDLILAYDDAAGRTPTTTFTETDNQLGGKTLTSGVYAFGHADTANLTAAEPLILDAEGDPEAVFIFQASSDLVTASGSEVRLINGAQFCRVFWQVGSSMTLGSDSTFVGHVFALTSITAADGARVQGQLLARNGNVTLINNVITNGPCTATLHVIKQVINDNGGTAVASDFTVHVKIDGSDVAGSPAAGAESPGTTYTLPTGTYNVSEDAFPGYAASYGGDSDASGNVTLVAGDEKTVIITNDDISPTDTATLYIIKQVINDDGRTAVASDFSIHVLSSGVDVAGSPQDGAVSPGTVYYLPPGDYVIMEDAYPHYTVRYGGDSDAAGNITLAAGDNKTVTVTNNDISINPQTGDNTADNSWIGISAAIAGGVLILFGICLYLRHQRREANPR